MGGGQFNTKETRIGLVRSLITSAIFLVFLKPIVEFLWNSLVKISNGTYSYYIDSIYGNASLGQRNWIDFIVFLFLSLGLIANLNTKVVSTVRRVSIFELREKIENETDRDKLNQLKKQISDKAGRSGFLRKFLPFSTKMLIGLVVIWNLIFFSFIFSAYADLQLNTSFSRRMNAIGPYASEKEIALLKSKWAMMQTRRDFESVNNKIDSIGRANKVVLPENLLK